MLGNIDSSPSAECVSSRGSKCQARTERVARLKARRLSGMRENEKYLVSFAHKHWQWRIGERTGSRCIT